jgi:quinohemoprotein amine dehydrogenase
MRFVGAVDEDGLFTPANDGPNPQRPLSEANVGDVWVEAWYMPDGARRPIGARAYLLVMPPKYNFQPIE